MLSGGHNGSSCAPFRFMQGLVRSIGISNMGVPEMTALAATAQVTPAVNQIELHPWLQWKHVTDYCKEHNIVLEVGRRLLVLDLHSAEYGQLLTTASCSAVACLIAGIRSKETSSSIGGLSKLSMQLYSCTPTLLPHEVSSAPSVYRPTAHWPRALSCQTLSW